MDQSHYRSCVLTVERETDGRYSPEIEGAVNWTVIGQFGEN